MATPELMYELLALSKCTNLDIEERMDEQDRVMTQLNHNGRSINTIVGRTIHIPMADSFAVYLIYEEQKSRVLLKWINYGDAHQDPTLLTKGSLLKWKVTDMLAFDDFCSQKKLERETPRRLRNMVILECPMTGAELKRKLPSKTFAVIHEQVRVIRPKAEPKPIAQTAKVAEKLIIKKYPEQAKKIRKVNRLAKPSAGIPKNPTAKLPNKTVSLPRQGNKVVSFLSALIEEGKMTQKEICVRAQELFPDLKPSTISTLLSDSKNPKYNKFPKLVIKSEINILSFTKN